MHTTHPDTPLQHLSTGHRPNHSQQNTGLCFTSVRLFCDCAHFGYNCPPKDPIISEPEPCYNQNSDCFPHDLQTLPQQYLCCENCGGPHETYQCQPMNQEYFYSSGFDQFQPPQFSDVYHTPPVASMEMLHAQADLIESMQSFLMKYDHIPHNEKSIKLLLAEEKFLKIKQVVEEEQFQPEYLQALLQSLLTDLQILNEIQPLKQETLNQIQKDQRKKIEDMSIEEMIHEQQLVDREIKEIINDLGYKRFRGEEIDEEYERDCEIRIRKLKQDFNIWGSEVRKKEKAYEDEKYAAACRYMLSVTCDDEDDYIPLAITPDLPIEEPDNSLNMGDEHLDTIPATESDEVIKSSVENLVPIPSEFEGIFDDSCDVLNCDNNRVNIESDFVESLINRDTSIVHSSKIDPIFEEIAGELAHIAPIPPGIVEADFDPNDDTSSDDDDFEDVEYVSFEEVNDVKQEEKDCLISNIESLKDNPILVTDSDSSDTSLSHLDNSLPEFETFSNHTEKTRSGNTTTHANYSLPEYESFHFDNSSFPRPPPELTDVENLEPEFNNFDVLNNNEPFDPGEGENIVFLNVEEDDSFTFTIHTFLPFLTYPEVSPLSCSTGSEDTIFDPDIFT
ncbi:hypothetical protein Tco_0213549 [Tanacetum coccineum]